MKKVTIDPITRLEGHGKIEIFLDDSGEVENAYLSIPELRGFEKFCVGRPVEELPRITPRICGVCPVAHHMASAKACDAVYHVDIPPLAKKLRELCYAGYFFSDHNLAFYFLGGPDFVVGPTAPAAERNILGVINKVGLDVGKEVIKHRSYGQKIIGYFGGKPIHGVGAIPGGISKGLTAEEIEELKKMADSMVNFAQFTVKVFHDIVLGNKAYVDMILSDPWKMDSYYMGLVDEKNQVNFYDGDVRVVDPKGKEFLKFKPADYLEHIAEHVEPWTYLKFPYLKALGWKGIKTGKDSGVYRVATLARLNVADGMATPLAQEEYQKMFETLGGKPAHNTLAFHWARVIEALFGAEIVKKYAYDPEIGGTDYRTIPTATPTEGVGIVEACRGTLIHHYKTDANGIVTDVNLIVATVHNNAAICKSIADSARSVIGKNKKLDDGVLNIVEMAFRAYDPCFGCGTHSLPGEMPLTVNLRDKDGNILQTISRK